MRRVLLALLIIATSNVFAGPGDTTWVQTFTFDTINTRRANFVFPNKDKDYSKVLMYYRLKCDPRTTRDQYDCGEWDYLTYTYVYDHTGKMDSVQKSHVNYIVNGTTPDNYKYTNKTRWNRYKKVKTVKSILDTADISSSILGDQHPSSSLQNIIQGSHLQSRSQFVYTKAELLASGLKPNESITSLLLDFIKAPGNKVRMKIKMKNYTGTFHPNNRDIGAFTTVYDYDFATSKTGKNQFVLNNDFKWDGSSDLVIEFSCDNPSNKMSNYEIKVESGPNNFGFIANSNNYFLDFEGFDQIVVPNSQLSKIDDQITVSLWCFGDEVLQPQNQSIFEGLGKDGNRWLNSHLPWSNSKVFFDAGGSTGGYDRMDKAANKEDFAGKWNHWVFTKNVANGSMKMYLNGNQWHSVTGKTKKFNNLSSLVIGSRATGITGSNGYDGFLDNFCIWNKELQLAEIKDIYNNGIKGNQASYNDILYYYGFNESVGTHVNDAFKSENRAYMLGTPARIKAKSTDLYHGFEIVKDRPIITLNQGVHNYSTNSITYYDTIDMPMSSVIIYEHAKDPTIASDTVWGWAEGYSYTYDENGVKTDSTLMSSTRTFTRSDRTYYDPPFEVIDRYEIARYITPYGKGLDLGPNGFLWMFDVTDYQNLLEGTVDLAAHNRQELIDLKFAFIEGTPARNPQTVKNLYVGNPTYTNTYEDWAKPKKVYISPNAERVVVKMRITGHGFNNNENCSEFCSKTHYLAVDGKEVYARNVWRDNCGYNPVQPQGGTWVYDRANWCPGAEVETYDVDITDYITPGDTATIDYSAQAYTWSGTGGRPYYRVEIQVVEFEDTKYNNDASVEYILSPNNADLYRHFNPACNRPLVVIKNNGKERLKRLTIFYQLEGAKEQFYQWTGDLGFLEMDTVSLPQLSLAGPEKAIKTFRVRVKRPNGKTDLNPINNVAQCNAETVPVVAPFYIEFRSNNAPEETEYKITNAAGEVVLERLIPDIQARTTYRDTPRLEEGCYKLHITDTRQNGLSWWAHAYQGSGYFLLRNTSDRKVMKRFETDFGAEIIYNFLVGDNHLEEALELSLINNPSNDGVFLFSIPRVENEEGTIKIFNNLGQEVATKTISTNTAEIVELDINGNSPGVYFATVSIQDKTATFKLLLID